MKAQKLLLEIRSKLYLEVNKEAQKSTDECSTSIKDDLKNNEWLANDIVWIEVGHPVMMVERLRNW